MIGQQREANGARFAFTDRWGGVSAVPYDELNLGGAVGDDPNAVRTNRELAAKELGLDPARVVWMNQVHGSDVAVVDGFRSTGAITGTGRAGATAGASASAGAGATGGTGAAGQDTDAPPAVDAVVTARRGLALAVLTADCTPVLLADPVAKVAGAAHAGRPGLVAGVVPATVEAMRDLGADPARIVAHTGPSVCGRCYEVPEAMRAEVCRAVPEAWATTSWGTPAVDVAAGVRAQLDRLGITDVTQSEVCTLESEDHFSYRRERTTGRLASYVWLVER